MMVRRILFGSVVVGAVLLAGTMLSAAPKEQNPGLPFQQLHDDHLVIEEKVDDIPEILYFDFGEPIDRVLAIVRDTATMEIAIDTNACASGLEQCSNFSAAGASHLNANPIRMFVLAKANKFPLTGLGSDAFGLAAPFFPGGGSAFKFCDIDCGENWFQDGGAGLYSIFLQPVASTPQSNWQAGQYAGSLEVIGPEPFFRRGVALVNFEIPFGLAVD